MIFRVIPHIVRSAWLYADAAACPAAVDAALTVEDVEAMEDVWYADDNACCLTCWACSRAGEVVAAFVAVGRAVSDIEAVAIDSRDRTRSNGYVEP